jgi:hypothetical protein
MTKGIDCAKPLTANQAMSLAASGSAFAARYLVPERFAWKRLTLAEAEAITKAGLQLVSVFETSAARAAGGAAAGAIDGSEAYNEAQMIGQPEGSAIYFAVDYDAQPRDYDAIARYITAASRQLTRYKIGVYGSYAVIEEIARRGAADHYWQTYAWSKGKKSGHANIYQYQNDVRFSGISVDLNESYGCEGWWNLNPIPESESTTADRKDSIPITVNGKPSAYGRQIDGHVYMPLRKLGEAAGRAVSWDNVRKIPYLDGHHADDFRVIDNIAYIQIRKAVGQLGGTVHWNHTAKTIDVSL